MRLQGKRNETRRPKWKSIMAALGVVYLVAFIIWGLAALAKSSEPRGASELASHPERQDEILAERKAAELQEPLGLSDQQVMRIADVFYTYRQQRPSSAGDNPSERAELMQIQMNRSQQIREEIASILTPEQQEAFAELRLPGNPRAPRGGRPPGGPGEPPGAPPGGGADSARPHRGGPGDRGPRPFEGMSREERREFIKNRIQNGGPPGMPPGPPPGEAPGVASQQGTEPEDTQ